MCCCELNSSKITPVSFQIVLHVSQSASSNLRHTVADRSLNGQFLCAAPRGASVLINEWFSQWGHCAVWGLGLHHSCSFSITWEKWNWPGGILSLFFRAKLSFIFLTFIPTNSIMAIKLRKSVRSTSYLTTQPRSFSPLQWSNLRIFRLSPGHSLILFPIWAPLPITFPLGG